MKMRLMSWVAALALAVGLFGGLARPAAADTIPATKTPTSQRFDLTGTIDAGGSSIMIVGSGAMSGTNVQEDFTMQLPGSPQATSFSIIMVDNKVYVRTVGLSPESDGQWYVTDATPTTGTMPTMPGTTMPMPMPGTSYDQAFTVTTVGHDTLNGAPTTHYHVVVDVQKLYMLMDITDPQTLQLAQNMTMSMDIWIGDVDQYLYKMTLDMAGKVEVPDQPAQTFTVALSLSFHDFDTAISIVAPPNAVPLSSLGGPSDTVPGLPAGISIPGMGSGSVVPGMPTTSPSPGMPRTGGAPAVPV